ncbi:MAG: GtrA family protein [Chitinophagaceae bacterium]
MSRHINNVRGFLLPVIDFFYPPFRRIFNLQTYRYAVCGGINALIGYIIYYITFKYILQEKDLDLGFYAFKSHIAALLLAFCVSFPCGFMLLKYLVFNDSNIRTRVQLFRYFMVCLFNLALNYILLKILVERFNIYPTIAQILTMSVVIVLSYLAQRHFSFKATPEEEAEAEL